MRKRLFHCMWAALLGVILTILLLWLTAATPAAADPAIRYVRSTGSHDGGNDCKTATDPCATIQHAIDVADPGDEIRVAGGTFSRTGTVAMITKELTIIGAFDPAFNGPDPDLYQTVLDAGWGGSVISITNAGDVLLLHLMLTHGDGSGNCGSSGCGGGVYATGTNLHIGQCVITDNVGSKAGDDMGFGGGVYAYANNRTVEIWNSRIVSNTASANPSSTYYAYGGGIYVQYGTTSLVQNQILDNVGSTAGTGGVGGGIFLYGVTQGNVLTNTIQGNKAATSNSSGSGGGLALFGSTVYMADNRIENNWTNPNWAGYGGGVYIWGNTDAHLTRNTIISNATLPPNTGWFAPGGGVCIASSEPVTLSNNLIVHNTASDDAGGGVYVSSSSTPASPALLVNNTIADNGASAVLVDQYAALTMTNNLIAGHATGLETGFVFSGTVSADTNLFWNTADPITGTHAILADPLLTSNYHLSSGSPAEDAGLTIPWLALDLEGAVRPKGSQYDIGAFEGAVEKVYLPLVLRDFH
jgi:hypothetical protein